MTIYLWSDGTWCYEDDISSYEWKSDDWAVIDVPEELLQADNSDDVIDEYVRGLV